MLYHIFAHTRVAVIQNCGLCDSIGDLGVGDRCRGPQYESVNRQWPDAGVTSHFHPDTAGGVQAAEAFLMLWGVCAPYLIIVPGRLVVWSTAPSAWQ
jgi:hypothetical protein